MDKKWGIVELLGYARHDWLNKIQLIKGNLELDKGDYVKEIIETIISEAKNEAKLSNLQMPKLTELFITSKWRDFSFILNYEVLQVTKGSLNVDDLMYSWMESFFGVLQAALDSYEQNDLRVVIYESENHLRFTFDLEGKIIDMDAIDSFLKVVPSLATVTMASFTNEELVFDISWNCHS
ncbi:MULTISPECIES: Spo0B C-terminal domain-containing protein [Bacillus]|uniref:Spo0B C-terminal domain-containing protein n=1 Tax=Bacillus TaxID=1386 RepID=UPI0002FE3AA8|nr:MULTISPECIES: Spo0B C-terminal domain-containing protein [Bacillus]